MLEGSSSRSKEEEGRIQCNPGGTSRRGKSPGIRRVERKGERVFRSGSGRERGGLLLRRAMVCLRGTDVACQGSDRR